MAMYELPPLRVETECALFLIFFFSIGFQKNKQYWCIYSVWPFIRDLLNTSLAIFSISSLVTSNSISVRFGRTNNI